MIIDGHCHYGVGDGLTGPWNTRAELPHYLRRAQAAGIDKIVLVPVFNSDYATVNAAVGRLAARHPQRFIPFCSLHAAQDAGRVGELIAEAVSRWQARGVKVHRYDAPCTREVCAAARRFRLPVLYDVVGEPYRMEILAREYPDVNFIVPHLGSFADDWRAHVQVLDQISRFPNVYADTAGVRRFDYLVQAVRRAGPHKLIFGSDGPWLHPALELHKVRLLGLSPADEAGVLGGNLQRLLRPVRAAAARRPVPA